jgi:hypothetical protein
VRVGDSRLFSIYSGTLDCSIACTFGSYGGLYSTVYFFFDVVCDFDNFGSNYFGEAIELNYPINTASNSKKWAFADLF